MADLPQEGRHYAPASGAWLCLQRHSATGSLTFFNGQARRIIGVERGVRSLPVLVLTEIEVALYLPLHRLIEPLPLI
jgi:hypothetical protein